MKIDHVGIATNELDELVDLFTTLTGSPVVREEEFGELRIVFVELENGFFEFLEPLAGEETIASYLSQHGGGIHHIAVETDDISTALETAQATGVNCIDESPRPGAWNHEVAFLHPDSTGGVLFEYVQHT